MQALGGSDQPFLDMCSSETAEKLRRKRNFLWRKRADDWADTPPKPVGHPDSIKSKKGRSPRNGGPERYWNCCEQDNTGMQVNLPDSVCQLYGQPRQPRCTDWVTLVSARCE